MSSGTPELYLSFMAGVALPSNADATFTDGTTPTIVKNVNYQNKYAIGGSAGIWFPTRSKLAGFDLGVELTGQVWYPDAPCCQNNFNGQILPSGRVSGHHD